MERVVRFVKPKEKTPEYLFCFVFPFISSIPCAFNYIHILSSFGWLVKLLPPDVLLCVYAF
ncbi:hypothetical protein Syun_003641 [Stephania yunnanensis]|uniref:Uncharacterized protein n=1 Tax=Stephania yunnanensis TaxID=152371 RepID=A0AAP0L3X9_9MAGN